MAYDPKRWFIEVSVDAGHTWQHFYAEPGEEDDYTQALRDLQFHRSVQLDDVPAILFRLVEMEITYRTLTV
jgi:hypothetical protein